MKITELEKRLISLEERLAKLEKQRHEETPQEQTQDVIEFEGKQHRKVDRKAKPGDVVIITGDAQETYEIKKYKPHKVDAECRIEGITKGCWYNVYEKMYNRTPETVDVYEPIQETQDVQRQTVACAEAKTANQLRAEIIERAKKFVEDITKHIGQSNEHETEYGELNTIGKQWILKPVFYVNEKKRVVTVLLKGLYGRHVYGKAIAKCHPNDVFNEDIGKAIALGRALGLDVSEFKNAVQPTKLAVGQIIEYTDNNEYSGETREIKHVNENYIKYTNGKKFTSSEQSIHDYLGDEFIIVDDTNAEY